VKPTASAPARRPAPPEPRPRPKDEESSLCLNAFLVVVVLATGVLVSSQVLL
jgi:hypothetical protein